MDIIEIVPPSAPFTEAQRMWLNGFLSGWLGNEAGAAPAADGATAPETEDEQDYPWHDDTMPLEERMALAEEKPFKLKLMAAMGQQDCGQCGYLCKSYAEALADGQEKDPTLCVPGGRETRQVVKELLADHEDEIGTGSAGAATSAAAPGTRAHPLPARIKSLSRLTLDGSVKDIRHVELDLTGLELEYRVGDSLGIYPTNEPALVDALLACLGLSGREMIVAGGDMTTTGEALFRLKDITKPSDEAVALLAEAATDTTEAKALAALASEGVEEGVDLLDLLESYPSASPDPIALVAALGDLQPRLYSISSSPAAHAGEVHATVAVVRYDRGDRSRHGVASTFLSERTAPGATVPVYIQPTADFRLPEDPATDIIMVGPGTGIAPFRSFLYERAAQNADGRAWLFFGNPNEATDYMYREEFEAFLAGGTLSRIDLAFSRDQAEKIYVQHRLLEHGADVWDWLSNGAYFYVCGDATRMAVDVQNALLEIFASHGGMDEEAAKAHLKQLTSEGRYLKDVY